MTEFLTNPTVVDALNTIFAALLTIIAALVGFGVRKFTIYLNEKVGSEKKAKLFQDVETAKLVADTFVRALQQSPAWEDLAVEEKKALAIMWMRNEINRLGLNIDWDLADKMIEEAVQKMKAEIGPVLEAATSEVSE